MALDTDYAESQIEAIRDDISEPAAVSDHNLNERDREALVEFDEQMYRDRQKRDRCGPYHHYHMLSRLIVYAEETGRLADSLKDGDEGEAALDEIIDWIHDQDYSGYSLQGHLSTLRVFAATALGLTGENDELPERFATIEPSAHVEEDPAPLPSNIIEYDDLIEMVKATDLERDRALLMTQWACGLRPMSELYTLQRKNVKICDDHVEITLPTEGKTDRRTIIVVVGSALLTKWIEKLHPAHNDPEAEMGPDTYIWTHTNQNIHLGYSGFKDRFTAAGERIGLEKDHSPQHFRRSAASVLAGQPYISERDLRHRFSWSPNSNAPEHYIAANSESTQVNVARCRGRDVENIEESPDTAPIVCPDCGRWTTRGLDACIWCGHDLDEQQITIDRTMSHPDAGEKGLAEMILDGDVSADELRTLRNLESVIKTEPDLFDELDDLIIKAEALEEAEATSGDTVSSLLGVSGLAGWLSLTASKLAKRWTATKHAALTIHPAFQDYPPSGRQLAGIALGWLTLLAVAAPLVGSTGIVQKALGGDLTASLLAVTVAMVGIWMVQRDLPDIDEAIDAARS